MQDGNISCHVGNLKRQRDDKSLRSAVETAAYNARTKLWSAQNEAFADVSHKGDITFDAVIAPEGAPDWALDRSEVWNRIDAHAPRKDTRLAKTIMGSIARQIPQTDRIAMVRELVAPWVAEGAIADVAIHADGSNHNPHVHVMLTTRVIKDDTFGGKIDSVEQRRFVTGTRQRWAELNNAYLKKNGSSLRLDHRSYKARGIGLEPTRHRGPQGNSEREHAPAMQQTAPAQTERASPAINEISDALEREPKPVSSATQEPAMREPTETEKRDYPLLTARETWPPPNEPTLDMNRAERSELRRYRDDMQLEKGEAERLLEAGDPAQQYPSERSLEAVIDENEEVRAPVHSSAQYARDLALEADLERAIMERGEKLRQEAIDMHRGVLGYTCEERELLAVARNSPLEEAKVIREYLVFKRMEVLQNRENERLQKDMAKYLAPERVQAMKDHIAQQEHEALLAARERAEKRAVAEQSNLQPEWQPPTDQRAQIVQGPNDEPLHPRERDLAEERLLDDMLREVEALPEPDLGQPIDHAHAARKMLRDFELEVDNEEREQDRER